MSSAAQEVETIGATHWPAKSDTIDRGGRKCGSGEKLATAWGERKRRAARCDKAAGWRRWGAGWGSQREGEREMRGGGCARTSSPRAAPLASRQSPADSACACVTRAAPCTALVPRSRRVPPHCGRERDHYATGETFLPNLSATCYVLTFGHFAYPLPGLFIPSCKCTLILLKIGIPSLVEFGSHIKVFIVQFVK